MHFSKTKPQKELKILKESIAQARQEKGLTQEELANAVCLSKWQIKEMEESDLYLIFYSMQIKIHAARRIGKYLGLKESEYLEEL
jgi:ribosome-binding protein aMBF1 (putative translation factor)